ncbi:MAG: hypothetical protein FWF82_06135, partial [Oscillospiraceae bacterium]|nr:hypothetical protein [Oscillospiraceae bacterium]
MNNSANGKSKPTPPHSHDGHRRRKKEQFLKNGLDGLPEHEPLEFLLYYAIPRGDTNGVAHALIEHFGSLASVVNADYEELLKVKGIGENAASLIYFTRMFSQLYLQKQAITEMSDKSKKSKLYCSDSLKKFCTSLFIGSGEEEIFCVYLTDNLIPLAHEKICTGELGKVRFPIRKTTRSVFKHNCSRLVVTH